MEYSPQKPSVATKTLSILGIGIFLIFLLHVALKYISIVIFNEQHGSFYELAARFDVNDENSVPQWFSQLLFLAVGLSSLLAASLSKQRSARRFWITVGAIGVLLSLDDVATLHEYLLQSLHNIFFLDTAPSFFVNAWIILLPFLLLIGAALAWWAWRVLPRRTMMLVVLGGLVYIIGKIFMDSLSNDIDNLFLDRGLAQGAEKLFQYSGITIVLYGILDYLERTHGSAIQRAVKQLK